MSKYKVIWFDDEYTRLNEILEEAFLNEIELVGFDNAQDGIDELNRNHNKYDAVLLDGIFYRKRGLTGDAINDEALRDVAFALQNLNHEKELPWFILSGQATFTKGENPVAKVFKNNKVYDKLSNTDLDQLWNDIKAEADKQEDTQIRNKFQGVFNVCKNEYIGYQASQDLLRILKREETIQEFNDPEIYFNTLRKIIEDLFKALNRYGLLPDAFLAGGNVALNESFRYLSGETVRFYTLEKPIFSGLIKSHVQQILSICQPASHRSEIDDFIAGVNSPYLLLSTTYQLLDVLLWFKKYIDDNPDIDINKKRNLLSGDRVGGIIEQDQDKNYHCNGYLLSYTFIESNDYKIGDEIIILDVVENKSQTKERYPKFIRKFQKIK